MANTTQAQSKYTFNTNSNHDENGEIIESTLSLRREELTEDGDYRTARSIAFDLTNQLDCSNLLSLLENASGILRGLTKEFQAAMIIGDVNPESE